MATMQSEYAPADSPCCGAMLHRPREGREYGKFFCGDCGEPWVWSAQTHTVTEVNTCDCGADHSHPPRPHDLHCATKQN